MHNFVSPENFQAIVIKPAEYLPFGESGPYRVVGVKDYNPVDGNEEVVIQDGIPNKQLAEKFLDVYLEDCVREVYFPVYGDC